MRSTSTAAGQGTAAATRWSPDLSTPTTRATRCCASTATDGGAAAWRATRSWRRDNCSRVRLHGRALTELRVEGRSVASTPAAETGHLHDASSMAL